MGYAFISYSSADLDKANAVRDLLLSKNIDCWMAKYDIEQNFVKDIGQKIRECSCFVLLLSNSAQNSEWVSREVALAIKYKKEILPIQTEKELNLNDEFSTYLAIIHIELVDKISEKDFGMNRVLQKVISFAGIKESEKKQQKENVVEKKHATKESKSVNNSDIDIDTLLKYYEEEKAVEKKQAKKESKPVNNSDIDSLLPYYGNKQIAKEVKAEKEEASDIVAVIGKDGWKYIGQMKDKKYHGTGTLYRPDGSKWYEGDWIDGKRHGKGTLYRPDGSKWYEGDWVNGKKHGKGTMFNSDGSKFYEGKWINGKINGYGTFYYSDGRTEERYYENDQLKTVDGKPYNNKWF